MDIFNSPEVNPQDKTLESAVDSITNDWRLTEYAASICSVNVLAVISRRQLRNELNSSPFIDTIGGNYVRDRRGVSYVMSAPMEVWELLQLRDDPTIPGVNGEFLISFRELGDARLAMVQVNPHPDVKPAKPVTI